MTRFMRILFFISLFVTLLAGSSSAITKVAKSLYVVDFYGGYASPFGQNDGILIENFLINNRAIDIDADKIYDPTYFFGVNYGILKKGHFMYKVGFRFTHHNLKDTVITYSDDTVTVFYPFDKYGVSVNQYDLDFNVNFYFTDLNKTIFSPYIGLGFLGGVTSWADDRFETEYQLAFASSLNAGFDVKLYTAPKGRSFLALSSMNSLNFWSNNDRPKYWNIGLGLKYFFRP